MKTGKLSSPMTVDLLQAGDRIRASKGPYIRTEAGRLPVGVRGLLTFAEYLDNGRCIRAFDATGGTVVLHVGGRRKNKAAPEIVCRPYVVTKAKPRRKKGHR